MLCVFCGRRLLRYAATATLGQLKGGAGPTCARKAGLLPQRVSRPRLFEGARRRGKRDSRQMEIAA